MPNTIKEFQLNQSTGEVSVEYSDDSTSKFNAADMVTAQTDAVTGGIGIGAAGVADILGYMGMPVTIKSTGGDDTARIDAAFSSGANNLFFPDASYTYNGTGWDAPQRFAVIGNTAGTTTINLGAASRLIDQSALADKILVQGIKFSGGLGAYRNKNTGGFGGSGKKIFRDNEFIGYTKCAIDTSHDDCPYWFIENNVFKAASSVGTIGVALGRNSDVSSIRGNAFERNAVHIKLWKPGYIPDISGNDFIQWDAGTQRVSVWVTGNNTNRNYVNISRNKFGNENQDTTDYRVALVPELAGTYNGDRLPDFSTLTMDGYHCLTVENNQVNGISGGGPLVYSVSGDLRGSYIGGNVLGATAPSYLLQYAQTFVDNPNESVLFGENYNENGLNVTPVQPCNIGFYGAVQDPRQLVEGDCRYPNSVSGLNLSRAGYVELLSNRIGSFGLANATKVGDISDSAGGLEAAEFSVVANAEIYSVWSTAPKKGYATWIEFDLAAGSANTADVIGVQIYTTSSTAPSYWARRCKIPAATDGWQPFRFCLSIAGNQATRFKFIGVGVGQVKIGRCRVYQSRSPVALGSATFDQLRLPSLPTSKSVPQGHVFADAANKNMLRLSSDGITEVATSGHLADKYFASVLAGTPQTVYSIGMTTGYPEAVFTFEIVGNRKNNGQQTKRKVIISANGSSSTANSVASVGTAANTLEFQDNAAWDFTISATVVSGKLTLTVTPTTYDGNFSVIGRYQVSYKGSGPAPVVTEN